MVCGAQGGVTRSVMKREGATSRGGTRGGDTRFLRPEPGLPRTKRGEPQRIMRQRDLFNMEKLTSPVRPDNVTEGGLRR